MSCHGVEFLKNADCLSCKVRESCYSKFTYTLGDHVRLEFKRSWNRYKMYEKTYRSKDYLSTLLDLLEKR